ncbi:RTA-like protein [Penicillium ucsense]|uniref:RTA-like protein n=1 Tax=Penicillium ucsense TaxID=2839758 RepID=A0A8J8VW78_9EURO|nr:RTA-like protein [Penicillium ucsense]KAF7729920.1 RTA-like protein [Penicillium ucsense]
MPSCVFQNPNVYWSYCPSKPAAILFAILYGLATCLHIAQAVQYRMRNAVTISMGAGLETVAFILRLVVIFQMDLSQVYEAQFILILIAPMWMNAFDFVLLGRLVNYCLPDKKLCGFPARRVGITFVGLDIGMFIIQLAGAAITTSDDNSTVNIGLHIYTAGVALQQFFILCFIGLSIVFNRRLAKECDNEKQKRVRPLLYTIYLSLALISFRVIFRIIEFAGDNTSKLSLTINRHEIFTYVFDSMPMLFALIIFNAVHPGKVLVGPDAEWPTVSKEEKKARKRAKKEARSAANDTEICQFNNRNLVITLSVYFNSVVVLSMPLARLIH